MFSFFPFHPPEIFNRIVCGVLTVYSYFEFRLLSFDPSNKLTATWQTVPKPILNKRCIHIFHDGTYLIYSRLPPHALCVRRPTFATSSPCFPLIWACVCPTQIDNEEYGEALSLAHAYNLDSDLVYQRQWRKSTVSIASIQDYLVRRRTMGER